MSEAERVRSINPILVLIWLFQLIIFFLDLNSDGRVSWSIPIIGSFFFVQLYMIWRTNYEKMQEERQARLAEALGGPRNVPDINPSSNDLSIYYKPEASTKPVSGPLLNLDAEESTESEDKNEDKID